MSFQDGKHQRLAIMPPVLKIWGDHVNALHSGLKQAFSAGLTGAVSLPLCSRFYFMRGGIYHRNNTHDRNLMLPLKRDDTLAGA